MWHEIQKLSGEMSHEVSLICHMKCHLNVTWGVAEMSHELKCHNKSKIRTWVLLPFPNRDFDDQFANFFLSSNKTRESQRWLPSQDHKPIKKQI